MTGDIESEWHLPPWTDDEVRNVNEFQQSGQMHALTCACNGVRVAQRDGLHCPTGRCPVQAGGVEHDITDGSLLRSIRRGWADAQAAAKSASLHDDWDF